MTIFQDTGKQLLHISYHQKQTFPQRFQFYDEAEIQKMHLQVILGISHEA